jgi:Holliday junction resolvasome RuvABC endonuclease subunit
VTDDDQRRYKEIWSELSRIRAMFSPYAIGVEAYRVTGARGGNAWKAAVVYGGVIFWAHTTNLYVAPFLPSDLKQRFCGSQKASKENVEESLYSMVDGLETTIQTIPKGQREHVADAAGHALLVMQEVDNHRKMLGLS